MPKKLLLADDSITIQKVVGITFAQEDYEIVYTDNGEDALKKAYEVKPDIILADIIMPQKNGYEVCEVVKRDPTLGQIPVLLLAGTFETFDESRGKQAGADGYIIKPFESQALIDKVNDLVKGKGIKPRVEAPAKPAAPLPPPRPAQPTAATASRPPSAQPQQPQRVQAPAPKPVQPPQAVMTPPQSKPMPKMEVPAPIPPSFQSPQESYTPKTSAPAAASSLRDKRMEPMLEFEAQPLDESPIPGFAEVSDIGAGEQFGSVSGPEQGEITAPPIELASPSEFIMDATGAMDAGFKPSEGIAKKEEIEEVPKPPTFDFVSGESDLSPESTKSDAFAMNPFDDLISPQAEIRLDDPHSLQTPKEPVQPAFAEPTLEPPSAHLFSTQETFPPVMESAQEVWQVKEKMTDVTSPGIKSPEIKMPKPSALDSQFRVPDDQMQEIITRVSQNVIEKIAWEVVPDLAERIIREEIKRLTEPKDK